MLRWALQTTWPDASCTGLLWPGGFVMLTRCCRGYFPHVPIDPRSTHCRSTSPTDMQGRRRPPTTDKPRENVPPVITLTVSASCKDFYASDAERRLVQQAKATHRDTTASAERALKVATETVQVGQGTLDALYHQGQQLDRAAHGVEQIDEEVKHASRILRFMSRCFCCRSDSSDPDRLAESRRRSLVQQQQMAAVVAAQGSAEVYAQKRRILGEAVAQSGVRAELFRTDTLIPAVPAGPTGPGSTGATAAAVATGPIGLGHGLHPEDRAELAQQTARQEVCLDQIDAAVGTLRTMGLAMGAELEEQVPKVQALQERTEDAGMALRQVAGSAAKMAGRAPRRQAEGSWQGDQSAAVAATARALQASAPVARRYHGAR
ncbi:hypothetical protein ABPG77_005993 [Micractinium sp. CCAP 211/92]